MELLSQLLADGNGGELSDNDELAGRDCMVSHILDAEQIETGHNLLIIAGIQIPLFRIQAGP